ncbi:hypothetical protein [Hydrogenophaga intermedia]|uniref:hypothetical protein n=1 Tax=Hydrogenophaga intermedia TaxID=65786 RepID=UPI0020433542|nr:hypothetical protein [Hydrogenophaga intermedia]MCM3565920.1 hypothetical protein [Hydrogenophaga intermedia]
MEPITALAALLPLGIEAGKAAIQRWLAPEQVKPVDFGQLLELRRIDLEQFKAMQGGGESYRWVAAVRELQRPVFSAGVLAVWAWQASQGEPAQDVVNMASAVGFYLFGDRTLFYVKGRAK